MNRMIEEGDIPSVVDMADGWCHCDVDDPFIIFIGTAGGR